jgi:hypothetical protein
MRGHSAALDNFDLDETEGEEHDRELKGFYVKNGGWKGDGWNQISWRRRKRQEQQEQLQAREQQRLLKDTEKRSTPLGRMDDNSLASWQEIASAKYKRVITGNYTDLLTFAEDSQLTHNLSAMSYEELLTGMLFPGEALQFIPPARIKSYRKLALDGHLLQSKGVVRAFFSDKRMFLIHTNFFQHPSVKDSRRKGKPLTTGLKEISCNLEDNLFWTAVNLEKLQAQTIDCEYKASTSTTVIVNRPKWAAKLIVLGILGILGTAFMPQDKIGNVLLAGVVAMALFTCGTWALLTRRQYVIEPSDPSSYRSRKILIGSDDPLHMQKVTLDCEMEEDYALADAFEWIQGLRSVCRVLAGDIVADDDELLDEDSVMKDGQDGRTLSQGVRRAPKENTVKALKSMKDKGKKLREELEEAEVKKVKPPKNKSKKKDVVLLDEDFEERMVRAHYRQQARARDVDQTHARTQTELPLDLCCIAALHHLSQLRISPVSDICACSCSCSCSCACAACRRVVVAAGERGGYQGANAGGDGGAVRKTPFLEPFIYKNDHFTKPGSGQT